MHDSRTSVTLVLKGRIAGWPLRADEAEAARFDRPQFHGPARLTTPISTALRRREESMDFAGAIHSNACDLAGGIDGFCLLQVQRRVSGDEVVEVGIYPAVSPTGTHES